jgi:signal transduction histidine kinase
MLELRNSPLFASCADDLYERIAAEAPTIELAAGERLIDEDQIADSVWLLLDGELAISKTVEGEELPVDHLSPGAYLGEISFLTKSPAGHRVTAAVASRLVRIPGQLFQELLRTCASTAEVVVKTLAERVRVVEITLKKRERLAGLGTLAAGLAHELNNPAVAARRAAENLAETIDELPELGIALAARAWTPDELDLLSRLSRERERYAVPPPADPLDRQELEDETVSWLEARGVEDAYDAASCLVEAGIGPGQLADLESRFEGGAIAPAVLWLAGVWLSGQLLREVKESTEKIANLVGAIKSYSKADSTTRREVDVEREIDTALLILGHKLRAAKVEATAAIDDDLPKVETFGNELYQIWTNVVDNAIDAMEGRGGHVDVRARREGGEIVVEISDDGPGIPDAIVGRIFDPFFTTKEVGKGTGLGLGIVNRIVARHHGRVDVATSPKGTTFKIVLPITQEVTP